MAASSDERTALVLGATGLVGARLLACLLADPAWARVVVLGRRATGEAHPKLEEHLIDFDHLEDHAGRFAADDLFCCLGTTIKQAGSEDAFRRVDYVYAFEAARLAANAGAEQLLVVSSLGANPRSRTFYLRIKGELEKNLARLTFRSTVFFRPSFLLGARAQPRPLETLMAGFLRGLWWLIIGPLGRYRPIAADDVAAAMVEVARARQAGTRIIESDAIRALAAGARR